MTIPNEAFAKWAMGFSGCNGGDIGSPENRSIWVCGLEHGGNGDASVLTKLFNQITTEPPKGWDFEDAKQNNCDEPWQVNLKIRFFRNMSKLLNVMDGNALESFEQFAENTQLFVNGSAGYFSMNLYPINFNNLKASNWTEDHAKLTGFKSKDDYMQWVEANRFPVLRNWLLKYQPRVIICVGKTKKLNFLKGLTDQVDCIPHKTSGNEIYSYHYAKTGTTIVIVPFMHGKSNAYINEIGNIMRGLTHSLH